jgi:hypothetical protein
VQGRVGTLMGKQAAKVPRGTVNVIASNGRLQARWYGQGKLYYLGVAQMQRDLDYGEFSSGDVSKYKTQPLTPTVTPIQLVELWGTAPSLPTAGHDSGDGNSGLDTHTQPPRSRPNGCYS